jgi:hypothetical protein
MMHNAETKLAECLFTKSEISAPIRGRYVIASFVEYFETLTARHVLSLGRAMYTQHSYCEIGYKFLVLCIVATGCAVRLLD